MSVLCQKQTYAVQQNALFDHLIGRNYEQKSCVTTLRQEASTRFSYQQVKISQFGGGHRSIGANRPRFSVAAHQLRRCAFALRGHRPPS